MSNKKQMKQARETPLEVLALLISIFCFDELTLLPSTIIMNSLGCNNAQSLAKGAAVQPRI